MKNKVLISILIVAIIVFVAFTAFAKKVDASYKFKNHYVALAYIQQRLHPKKYLEIGIEDGYSINLTAKDTLAVGVDPVPRGKYNKNVEVFGITSDDFFKSNPTIKGEKLDATKFDLIFIDGLHLYEYVLRDFINSEKLARKDSIIILHDTVPISEAAATRKIPVTGTAWTGDVYRIVPTLRKYRPDLKIETFNVAPSGLCFITNLDPNSTVLSDNYDKILNEFKDFSYSEMVENQTEILNLIDNNKGNLDKILNRYLTYKDRLKLFYNTIKPTF